MRTRLHFFHAMLLLGAMPALAQIPNGGFETWVTPTGATFQDPDQWGTLNQVTTGAGAGLSCEKGTPGAVGSAYVKLTTKNVPGIGNLAGQLTTMGSNGQNSFPYASRPGALNGMWKHAIMPNDSGIIIISLTKFNAATQSDEAVGIGGITVMGTQTAWQAFSAPIQYVNQETPDKAMILILTSSGVGVAGSTLSLDDLSFGAFTGIGESAALPELSVRPTLATDLITVTTSTPMAELSVLDMSGRTIKTVSSNLQQEEIGIANLPNGRYLMKVRMADGRLNVRSFMKQ